MKILVIHQYYLMPGQAGGSRFNEFARLWSEAGHEVTVVAGSLDVITGLCPRRYRRRWITREHDGPVTVWRCYVPSIFTRGYAGRSAAFLGFVASATTATFLAPRPDVVIATSPPPLVAFPGWVAARARLRRVPWIFEIRDLWPEGAVSTGVLGEKSIITKGLYLLERYACSSADRINVLTPAFRDNLVERGLATADKILFVPNGADTHAFTPGPRDNAVRREFGWGNRFVILYAGAHGRANAVEQLVDAAERLRDRSDILIACVGYGPDLERLQRDVQSRQLNNMMFCGTQPKHRMPDFVNACDMGAAVLQDNPTFKTVYPNKVFDYMSCGRPVLLAIDGVARQLVCTDAQAGVFVPPEQPDAIAATIRHMAEDPDRCEAMGRRGRQWVLANATRETLARRYLQCMQELVSDTSERDTPERNHAGVKSKQRGTKAA